MITSETADAMMPTDSATRAALSCDAAASADEVAEADELADVKDEDVNCKISCNPGEIAAPVTASGREAEMRVQLTRPTRIVQSA